MSFVIRALPESSFRHLFDLTPVELASQHAIHTVATSKPGFPCRVSLTDAEIGEEVILVHYEHQPVDSPFKSSHAVYIRHNAIKATPQNNEIPEMLRSRTLSLRGFDSNGMMVAAELADGAVLETAIEEIFRHVEISYIHLHFAKPGCYAALVNRA